MTIEFIRDVKLDFSPDYYSERQKLVGQDLLFSERYKREKAIMEDEKNRLLKRSLFFESHGDAEGMRQVNEALLILLNNFLNSVDLL